MAIAQQSFYAFLSLFRTLYAWPSPGVGFSILGWVRGQANSRKRYHFWEAFCFLLVRLGLFGHQGPPH